MRELLKWGAVIVIGAAALTPLMIAFLNTRPIEELPGIAYFLLCQLVPLDAALVITSGLVLMHAQRQLARLRGELPAEKGKR